MARGLPLFVLVLTCAANSSAAESQDRVVESVLPSLDSGPACWSGVDLRNLGDRQVVVDVEAHRATGGLVPLVGHSQVMVRLNAGEHINYRLEIQDDTGAAWVKIRERIPSPRLFPVVAVTGTTECVIANELRTTGRVVAYPTKNPWFAGEVGEMPGAIISVVNTSERAVRASLCYSAGNLYSVPSTPSKPVPQLAPICSQAFDVQIPPFGARQFPVDRDGNSYFTAKTEGEAVVLQMLRPLETGVKVYTVDSTIKFGGEISAQK